MAKKSRVEMPVQDPKARASNFEQVSLGYTEEMALEEASRCLSCKRPFCVQGCPVSVDIPGFIKLIKEKKYQEAINAVKGTNNLPAVCGRVCPQESQCESKCILGRRGEPVAIGRLERFVADWELEHGTSEATKADPNGKKVAVIGAGPAGLTCAGDLAKLGYDVTIFESLHEPGGVLIYGIPEFRLPKDVVRKEVDYVRSLGVKIETSFIIGRTMTIDELLEQEGFDAVFIGSGAGLPMFMNIPGEP